MNLFLEIFELIKSAHWTAILTMIGSASTIAFFTFKGASWLSKSEIKHLKDSLAEKSELLSVTKTNATLFQKEAEVRGEEARKAVERAAKYSAHLTDAKVRDTKMMTEGNRLLKIRASLQEKVAEQETKIARLTGQAAGLDGQLAEAKIELERRQKLLDKAERRIKRAIGLRGFLWTAKSLRRIPTFHSIHKRRQAIISVLNLKGGVGKTTVAAQLGVAFARRGYRVLFIDLDLQGSLTDTLLPLDKVNSLASSGRMAQDFFEAASASSKTRLQEKVEPIATFPATGGSVHLLGASDNLGYTELSLTLRWLVNASNRDSRFLLRRGLHVAEIAKAYDVVFIDCPPVVNMSCINALAASDYVLIPSTLDNRAIERAPVLIGKVLHDEKFIKYIHHGLKLLGLVANRTRREELTTAERDGWGKLSALTRDEAGHDVRQFATNIPLLDAFRDAVGLLDEGASESRAAATFHALSLEIEQEWPDECKRTATPLS